MRELYDRIDGLERSRAKAAGRGERAPELARQLLALREEVKRALEPEAGEGSTDVSPGPIRRAQNARSDPKGPSPGSPPEPSGIDKPRGTPDPREGPRTSPRAVVGETESEGQRAVRPPRARTTKSIAGHDVRALARDYIYGRLDELEEAILGGSGAEREEARKERAFLEGQLRIVHSKGRGRADLDPALVRSVRESILRTPRPAPEEVPGAPPKDAPPAPSEDRPPCWSGCEKMDFGGLRRFIDDSLREPSGPNPDGRPRSKREFLALWGMLRGKIDAADSLAAPPVPAKPPKPPRFTPSRGLKASLDQLERLTAELNAALADPGVSKRSRTKLRRKLNEARDACERRMKEEKGAHERESKNAALRGSDQRILRLRIAKRVRRDIERAFEFGDVPATARLPWRVLPPGELSVGNVLRHYEGLQRRNPHVVYDKERIAKAFSLRPDRCYVGSDEFEGYIVFAFSHTEKVLLECPVFGNAIYVIHSDWRRLSKTTKQDLLSRRSREVTRIFHRGDWFSRVKRALEIR